MPFIHGNIYMRSDWVLGWTEEFFAVQSVLHVKDTLLHVSVGPSESHLSQDKLRDEEF